MKTAALLILLSIAALSQQPSDLYFSPSGPWLMCEDIPSLASNPLCTSSVHYAVNQEPDLIIVKATNASTSVFGYSITGLHPDGSTISVQGYFPRADNSSGYSAGTVNVGRMASGTISVTELVVVGGHSLTQ